MKLQWAYSNTSKNSFYRKPKTYFVLKNLTALYITNNIQYQRYLTRRIVFDIKEILIQGSMCHFIQQRPVIISIRLTINQF